MSAPFCTGCGATVAAGTRFCVKCGQPVGLGAAPVASTVVRPAPPPRPPPPAPPPPQAAQFPVTQDPAGLYPLPPPAKQGARVGLWIGLFGVLLLIVGAGLWYGVHAGLLAGAADKRAAATPESAPPPVVPAPSTTPENPPPNPDLAKPEVITPNPDLVKKDQPPPAPVETPVRSAPARPTPADPAPLPPPEPAPVTPKPVVKAPSPTSGVLHAAVEVQQNGEVVFENLPAGRLRFTYDHTAWQPTIHRQANGTQTLVMRSLKAGIQRSCDVQWEMLQK